jgi:pyruvate dehydrogenase E2 component (dihydrolipoamide acetyltransferase)
MDVLMPQLGETVAEGKITRWFKAAGEKVAPGDNLFEIETDKTSMEVPATTSGVLAEIRVAVGAVAPVGAVVAVIVDGQAAAAPAATAATSAAASPKPSSLPKSSSSPAAAAAVATVPAPTSDLDPFHAVRTPARNFGPARLASGTAVSPLARRLAVESGIDLTRVPASGAHGRILARDVEGAIASHGGAAAVRSVGEPSAADVKAIYAGRAYDEMPLDAMRRLIAARLTQAAQTVPQFHLSADVDLDRLEAVRSDANAGTPKGADGQPAFRLSLNDFVVKALAVALNRVPAANAVWAHDRILRFSSCDIGVAVALDGGLITPVIRSAETKSVIAISREMKELAARARAGKLEPRDYQGGATTISNLGMYAIREFTAIINPPQSTILAVGAAERRPVETEDGGVRFVSRATVTLGCDHRVVDGALAAELMATFRHAIEHPIALML